MNKREIEDIIDKLKSNLFGNSYSKSKKAIIICKNNIVKLESYFYEPGYEYFVPTCSIKVNKNLLFKENSKNVEAYRNETINYGKHNNIDDAIQEVATILKNKRCRVFYLKEKKHKQLIKER